VHPNTALVRIAIVEDQMMMADALAIICTRELGCKVVARARTGREAIKAILVSRPELVILDLGLPDTDGFKVMDVVRQAGVNPRVLVLSAHCDDNTVYRVERARFDGFVDKGTEAFAALRVALKAIARRRRYFSDRYLKVKSKRKSDPLAFDKLLTGQQQAVLAMIGGLLTDDEIASRLRVKSCTAEKHRLTILQKLGLDSKITLLRYAHSHGFKPLVDGLRSGKKQSGGSGARATSD
jgi:DNA-binding NarL/FixJ family response regulator